MTLIVFAAVGLILGYVLGTSRRGFATMATVSIGSVVVAFMLLGALVRNRSRDHSHAA
jgi:hypothetical protein